MTIYTVQPGYSTHGAKSATVGTFDGKCNRSSACAANNAMCYNRGSGAFYCDDCMELLNRRNPELMSDGGPMVIRVTVAEYEAFAAQFAAPNQYASWSTDLLASELESIAANQKNDHVALKLQAAAKRMLALWRGEDTPQEMVFVGALPPDSIAVGRADLRVLLDAAERGARLSYNMDAVAAIRRWRGLVDAPPVKGPTPPSDLASIGG